MRRVRSPTTCTRVKDVIAACAGATPSTRARASDARELADEWRPRNPWKRPSQRTHPDSTGTSLAEACPDHERLDTRSVADAS